MPNQIQKVLIRMNTSTVQQHKVKMKIFQLVQTNFLLTYKIGLQKSPLSRNILVTIFIFSVGFISNCAYFYYEAKTFKDHASSMLFCIAMFTAAIIFTFIAFNMRAIFGYVIIVENIINDSKSLTFFLIKK